VAYKGGLEYCSGRTDLKSMWGMWILSMRDITEGEKCGDIQNESNG
jgi:hypothetical protein